MRRFRHAHAGADWIADTYKVEPSPLGAAVADILGLVFRGIYHLQSTALGRVDWSNSQFVSVKLRCDLATWDGSALTELVILAHECCIRISIQPCNPQYLDVMFHARERDGAWHRRHPTIEQAIESVRAGCSFDLVEVPQ